MPKIGLSGLAAALQNQAAAKPEEVQQKPEEVAQKPEEIKPSGNVEEVEIYDAKQSLFKDLREITIEGALPGVNLNKMVEIYGKATDRGDNIFTFANWLEVEVDEKNIAKTISAITSGVYTAEGVFVGADEKILNSAYGTADEVEVKKNGADYKYYNKAKTRKFTFISREGVITKIKNELIK